MAGTLRQAMVFLGLADEGYDQPSEAPARRTASGDRPLDHAEPARGSSAAGRRRDPDTDTQVVIDAEEFSEGSHRAEPRAEEPASRAVRENPVGQDQRRPAALVARRREASESVPDPREREYRAPVTPINRAAAQTESDNELRRITTIHPRSYNDAKVIGESFRENVPVIMNVTDMDVAEAKRLVDFSSGLTFALNGSIERVTAQVFLLTPANLEVLSSEDLDSPEDDAQDDHAVFNQS